jgi:ArsR family transcriptional regulator
MKRQSIQLYEARAKIAKALAHPSRLMMLDALRDEELTVSQLTELVGADQSTISKHLAILRDVGFLKVRREGTLSYYAVKCQCLDGFFGCIETVLRQNLAEQQELVQF